MFLREINFISEKKKKILKNNCSKKHSNSYKEWLWEDEVKYIKENMSEVYDFCIPDGHYYLANGFISHNSNLRWLEYSALKIPTIASKVEPFKRSITDGINGILVDYDSDEWIQAISELIEDKAKREDMGQTAYKTVKKDYNTEKIAGDYLNLLKDFVGGKKKMNISQYDEVTDTGTYRVMT